MFISRRGALAVLCSFVVVGAAQYLLQSALGGEATHDVPLEQLPQNIGDWQGRETDGLGIKELEVLKLDRYVRRFYRSPEGADVYLYIGYWKKQTGDFQGAKHSPSICLPSAGWVTDRRPPQNYTFAGSDLTAKRLVAEFRGQKRYFYYWFFSGEHTYSEEWSALFNLSIGSLLYGRSDGGIVELAVDIKRSGDAALEEKVAADLADKFIKDFYPKLTELLNEPARPS